jgi:hypothetical protein
LFFSRMPPGPLPEPSGGARRCKPQHPQPRFVTLQRVEQEDVLPMLKHTDEMQEANRPEISELIERLSAEGRSWAEAELALARAELGELKGQAIRAVTFAIVGFAAVFCALVVFSQAAIAFLTPHVDGPGVAALVVGGVLLLLVVLSYLVMRSAFSWRTDSIFFRWFGRNPTGGARS